MSAPYAEVIGDPIAHSKSPLIHNGWLAKLGIKAEYRATLVRPDELSSFLQARRSDPNWLGCNVTIPHKRTVIAVLDEQSEEAKSVGAVNCVRPRGQDLIGYNTDVDGVAAALDGIDLEHRHVAMIGAGGAAHAALTYLAKRHVEKVNVLARDPQRARALEMIVPQPTLKIGPFSEARALVDGVDLVINASPLGMTGCAAMSPELLDALAELPATSLFDMVYDPVDTAFLSIGRSIRINGLKMLLGQAARAFELFFDAPAPQETDDLRNALLDATTTNNRAPRQNQSA